MKLKQLYYVAAGLLAAGLVQTASAQPAGQTNYFWTGAGDGTTWSLPSNWSTGIVPQTNGTTFQIFLGTGFPTTTPTPIVLGPSDNAILNDQIFGPEWGETFNIYGTVRVGFGNAPMGAIGGPKSTVNVFGTGSVTSSDSIFIGDPFWFAGGPNVDYNLFNSSTLTSRYIMPGGHLNLYDSSTASASIALLAGTPTAGAFGSALSSDLTRWINLAGGTLILTNGNTGFITNLIGRGIFLCYGKKFDTNEFTIVDNGTNTIVTVTNSLGTLNSIAVQAGITNMMVGTFQPAVAVGNFANMSAVPLSFLDAAQSGGGTIAYQSSDTTVVSVSAAGVATALKPGTANVTATFNGGTFGSFSSINTVIFTVTPFTNSLAHRYSFSETSGGTTADSVPGNSPTWDGTLNGGATLGGGAVTLDGIDGFVQFPAGIITNLDAVTIEAWANIVTPPANSNAWLFAFGNQDASPSPQGMNYIGFIPYTAAANASALFGLGDPGFGNEQDATYSLVGGGVTNYLGNVHVVCIYHPYAGFVSVYTNGVLAAVNNNVTHALAATLGNDPINVLGLSLYAVDPFLQGSIDEFRIYKGPLSAAQIAATQALGPNQTIGTSMNVSLSALPSGGNVMIKWPTTSALVGLLSSPVLGPGAVWTPVTGALTVSGGNYQMPVPIGGSARFFRLQQY